MKVIVSAQVFLKRILERKNQKIFNKICYQLMKKVLDSSKFKEQDLFFKEQRKKKVDTQSTKPVEKANIKS